MKMIKKHQLKAIKSVRKVYAPAVKVVAAKKGGVYDRPQGYKWIEEMRYD